MNKATTLFILFILQQKLLPMFFIPSHINPERFTYCKSGKN